MRGARCNRAGQNARGRIIPACAGSTITCFRTILRPRDHPRACGEHVTWASSSQAMPGSSPRVRGAPNSVLVHYPDVGIIPACAGSTSRRNRRCRVRGDHPRVCGEHQKALMEYVRRSGSSPRVRGALCSTGRLTISARDHPRVCGEHAMCSDASGARVGSSPRVRGARSYVESRNSPVGIIPACAGSTVGLRSLTRSRWDHPRVCGEHQHDQGGYKRQGGSSPRVRGAPVRRRSRGPAGGIIPACAGST